MKMMEIGHKRNNSARALTCETIAPLVSGELLNLHAILSRCSKACPCPDKMASPLQENNTGIRVEMNPRDRSAHTGKNQILMGVIIELQWVSLSWYTCSVLGSKEPH